MAAYAEFPLAVERQKKRGPRRSFGFFWLKKHKHRGALGVGLLKGQKDTEKGEER